MKSFIFLLVASMFLMSCGHFNDGTSIWGAGLWLVPWLTGIAAVICFAAAVVSGNSNSTTQTPGGRPTKDNTGNVGATKTPFFWWGVVLIIATVIVIIMVNADK
jgi:hypothetical protein